MLDEERRYYDEQLETWLGKYPGRFVVVRERELVAVCDTQEQALAEGARRFGLTSFLVRRVERTPPEVRIPALSLGILNADPSRSDAGPGSRP